MPLITAYQGARILEATENYGRSGGMLVKADTQIAEEKNDSFVRNIIEDHEFWSQVLSNPEKYWNQYFNLNNAILSEWLPRIPGLYFSRGSEAIRKLADSQVAFRGPRFTEFTPSGKSSRVLGGVGTLRFAPSVEGHRLFTATMGNNASSGIPVLITNEVYEQHKPREGELVNILNAQWRAMDVEWSPRFPSVSGIPKGYLLVNKPEQIQKQNKLWMVEFHPCTIMEYESGNSLLYSFVFFCADGSVADYRTEVKDWVKKYRTKENRRGRYLLEADIANPFFDAKYNSPEELNRDEAGIKLITDRVRQTSFNERTVDEILELINKKYTREEDILALAGRAGISSNRIIRDAPVRMTNSLISYCIENECTEQLVDVLLIENPTIEL
jgi:hypothetical protein